MIDPQTLAAIKQRAERAGAHEWYVNNDPDDGHALEIVYADDPDKRVCFLTSDGPRDEIAAHIAGLDPQTVLALVAEIERLTVERDAERERCAKIAHECNARKLASGEYAHGYWDACNEIAELIGSGK